MKKERIAICVVGTESFLKPLKVCLNRVQSAIHHLPTDRYEVKVIVVTDTQSAKQITALPYPMDVVPLDVKEDGELYKKQRQLLIAKLQNTAFAKAREWNCDYLWSVEADVLVPPNALTCSLDMLRFDNGYFSVAFVTYPSHGGGSFLGGHGAPDKPILEDFTIDERSIPKEYKKRLTQRKREFDKLAKSEPGSEKMYQALRRYQRLHQRAKRYPPLGNIFQVIAKCGWRKRGWLDYAYPALGKGAVVPTDWTGLGCTLMNKHAASLATFEGYEGLGTQDLHLNWKQWFPAGMKFCAILHTLCDHIVRDPNAEIGFSVLHSYHETAEHAEGHLRVERKEFHEFY